MITFPSPWSLRQIKNLVMQNDWHDAIALIGREINDKSKDSVQLRFVSALVEVAVTGQCQSSVNQLVDFVLPGEVKWGGLSDNSAVTELLVREKNLSPSLQFVQGVLYAYGNEFNFPVNIEAAVMHFKSIVTGEESAYQQHARLQMAFMADFGLGCVRDFDRSKGLLVEASQNGLQLAADVLAGERVKISPCQAKSWLLGELTDHVMSYQKAFRHANDIAYDLTAFFDTPTKWNLSEARSLFNRRFDQNEFDRFKLLMDKAIQSLKDSDKNHNLQSMDEITVFKKNAYALLELLKNILELKTKLEKLISKLNTEDLSKNTDSANAQKIIAEAMGPIMAMVNDSIKNAAQDLNLTNSHQSRRSESEIRTENERLTRNTAAAIHFANGNVGAGIATQILGAEVGSVFVKK